MRPLKTIQTLSATILLATTLLCAPGSRADDAPDAVYQRMLTFASTPLSQGGLGRSRLEAEDEARRAAANFSSPALETFIHS